MSEQESLGEVNHDNFWLPFMSEGHRFAELPEASQEDWERAAQAVAARVREECARLLEIKAEGSEALRAAALERGHTNDAVLHGQFAADLRATAFEIRAMNEASHD